MRATFAILVMLFAASVTIAQPPAQLWQNYYGDTRTDRGYDLGLQSDGTILVVGETRVHQDVQDNDDAIVIWLNTDGDSLDALKSGTEDTDEFGRAIYVNDDDTFIIAGRKRQPAIGGWAFMAKYSANGDTLVWEIEEHFNEMPQNFHMGGMVMTPDGGYVLCGARTNGMGWGPEITFLWKVNSAGATEWLQEYAISKYAYSIALRPDGGFLVAGANYNDAWVASFDEFGVLLYHQAYSAFGSENFASGIIALDDGGGVFCGTILNQSYEHRARVLRFDDVGEIVWDARFGEEAYAYDIIKAQDGNYIVAGSEAYNDTTEYPMIAEVSADGHLLWYIVEDLASDVYRNYAVDQRTDGTYVTAGYGYPNDLLDTPDIMVARYDSEANIAPVELTITPYQTEFAASGGTLVYDLDMVSNTNLTFTNVRFWSSVIMPGGNEISPLDQAFLTVTPFMQISVDGLTQNIPAAAPAGEYTFIMHLGRPDELFVEDSFTFTKLGDERSEVLQEDWSGSGLHRLTAGASGDIYSGIDATPDNFGLSQAYPNPFNAQTTISVMLPTATDLTVSVFNTMGQQVATIARGSFSAGTHELSFDASNLSSGIYFFTMQTGDFTAARKMMLMK